MPAVASRRISVWLDRTSDPADPHWIVSRDAFDPDGEPLWTDTIRTFPEDGEGAALEYATELARGDRLIVHYSPGGE